MLSSFSSSSFRIPVGKATLGRVLNGFGQPIDGLGPIESSSETTVVQKQQAKRPEHPEQGPTFPHVSQSNMDPTFRVTGIKAIDLLCPLFWGQHHYIMGPAGTGKTRLSLEIRQQAESYGGIILWLQMNDNQKQQEQCKDLLINYMKDDYGPKKQLNTFVIVTDKDQEQAQREMAPSTVCALAQHWLEQEHQDVFLILNSLEQHQEQPTKVLNENRNGLVTILQTCFNISNDHHHHHIGESRGGSTIVLSRTQAEQGIFPAFDFDAFQPSIYFTEDIVGSRHHQIATECRQLLATHKDSNKSINIDDEWHVRAAKLRYFLTQPLWHCEHFTGIHGQYVSMKETLDGCEEILSGGVDDIPPQDFWMVGSLQQVKDELSKRTLQ